jgi:nicotinate-nucleotide pyrophosphorylase (carboxylating)
MIEPRPTPPADVAPTVTIALAEDVGSGDLTATLLAADATAAGQVIVKEPAVLCGAAWFNEVFRQLDARIRIRWHAADGDDVAAGTVVCELEGPARGIVTGERTALNFLQTLSGTATATRAIVELLAGTRTRVLDTRKTVPGLRSAQKYAVRCGGGMNHRQGLFDAVLIKENHIAAGGGLAQAVRKARDSSPKALVEVEVETLGELEAALDSAADRIMLDDFSFDDLRRAVALRDAHGGRRQELEASGSIDADNLRQFAATGVDFVSIGALTKHVRAVDFSLRLR